MDKKQEYLEAIEARLEKLKTKIEEVKAKTKELGADTRAVGKALATSGGPRPAGQPVLASAFPTQLWCPPPIL